MKTPFASTLIALALAAAAPAQATPVTDLIVNGSFEQSVTLGNGSWTTLYSAKAAQGWISDAAGYEVRNKVAGTAKDGDNFVELDTDRNSAISQIVQTTLGQTYKLSFWYAPRAGVAEESNRISVFWNEHLIDTVSGNGSAASDWTEMNYVLAANSDVGRLTFRATGRSDSYGGSLDMVSMTTTATAAAAVPEPGTSAMLLAGLGLMAAFARRRTDSRA